MYTYIQTCTYMSTAYGGLSNNYLEMLNEAVRKNKVKCQV